MSSAAGPSLEITLAAMRFHVRVGILPHERKLPQPLEVDLRVRQRHGADAVLDYRHLYALVSEVAAAEPHAYLEDVARRVHALASALPGVQWARVAVRKPHVGLEGPLAYAEIVVDGGGDA